VCIFFFAYQRDTEKYYSVSIVTWDDDFMNTSPAQRVGLELSDGAYNGTYISLNNRVFVLSPSSTEHYRKIISIPLNRWEYRSIKDEVLSNYSMNNREFSGLQWVVDIINRHQDARIICFNNHHCTVRSSWANRPLTEILNVARMVNILHM
jgi:hypothetical protein